MTTATRELMHDRIRNHGNDLLAIFPAATERDPVKLCKKLRRLEAEGAALALRLCNGPEFAAGEDERIGEDILWRVNALLGNVHEYQPKTGARCGCRRGVQRDNCSACEGTGFVVDFREIRNRKPLVPVFLNLDPRGYALKIKSEDVERLGLKIHRDWGGYGIIAPDLSE